MLIILLRSNSEHGTGGSIEDMAYLPMSVNFLGKEMRMFSN